MPRSKEPPELVALDRARQQVEQTHNAYREAIRRRNIAAVKAKQAGHPAGTVYRRAGISQSTFSRQEGATTGQ